MMPGNRSLVRRLRRAAKREVMARGGAKWRGWGAPILERSAAPVLRLMAPALVLGLGLASLDGPAPALVLFTLWSFCVMFYLATVLQDKLRDPVWLAMSCQLPLDAHGIHRVLAGGMWRDVRFIAYDWLWLFAAVMSFGKSWGPATVAAALAGALVMAAVVLALAGCLAVLPARRINWAGMSMAICFAAVMGMVMRDKIPADLQKSVIAFLEKTPFRIVADFALASMRGEAGGWIGLAMSAATATILLAALWRMSARKFDPYVWDSDAAAIRSTPPDAVAEADASSADAVRAALAAELARPPGSLAAECGLIEKRVVSMAGADTRRTLDLLAPFGMSWGTSWLAAAGLLAGGLLAGVAVHRDIAHFALLIALMIALPLSGGKWMLLLPAVVGNTTIHQWPALPLRLKDLGRAILLTAHVRLLLAMPLMLVAARLYFPDTWFPRTVACIMLLALAALPLGVVFHWISAVPIFGTKGRTSFKRIFAALGFALLVIALALPVFIARPSISVAAGLLLIAGCHLTRIVITRRIERGIHDFV